MDKLTQTEQEVLSYLIKGLSNVEIGKIMSISKHTAKAHVCSIIKKYECNNRINVAYLVGKYNIL